MGQGLAVFETYQIGFIPNFGRHIDNEIDPLGRSQKEPTLNALRFLKRHSIKCHYPTIKTLKPKFKYPGV